MKVHQIWSSKSDLRISMTFAPAEGWEILAALHEYASKEPAPENAEECKAWVRDLETELPR